MTSLPIGLLLMASSTALAQAGPDGNEARLLEPVVVTVRRKAEDQVKVAASVSVLDTEGVQALGVTGFDRLNETVPNLNVQRRFGSGAGPIYALRGQDVGTIALETDVRAGMYVDEVYMGRMAAVSAFALADLCGVMVLRGPQGTLFGGNAAGGVVRLASCAPTEAAGGTVSLLRGNLSRRQEKITLDAGEHQGLSARLVALSDENAGWVRNERPGLVTRLGEPFGAVVSVEDFGRTKTRAVAFAARFDSGQGLTIDYRYDHTRRESTQAAVQLLATYGAAVRLYDPALDSGGTVPQLTQRDSIAADFMGTDRLHQDGQSVTVDYRWSPQLSAKYIVSTRQSADSGNGNDIDGTAFNGNFLIGSGISASPEDRVCRICSSSVRSLKQHSNEIRLLAKSGRWDGVGGLFQFHESGALNSPTFILGQFKPDLVNEVGSLSRGVPSDYFSGRVVSTTNKILAAYGHASYALSEAMNLSAGLRRSRDQRNTDVLRGTRGTVSSHTRYGYTDWEAAASYGFAPELMAYAKIGTGHLAGGTQAGVPFAPEVNRSAEIGLKASRPQSQLWFNAAVFRNQIDHQQLGSFSSSIGSYVVDAGASTQWGLELEARANLARQFLLHTSYGYLKARNDNGLKALAPRQTLYLGLEYRPGGAVLGMKPSLRLDASWRDKTLPGVCMVGQSASPAGCNGAGDAGLTRAVTIPARTDLSARFNLDQIALGNLASGRVSLWVRNLLNSRKLQFARDLGNGTVVGNFVEPRTFGVEMKVAF